MLSQSVRFCRLYIQKHFGVFFFGLQCKYAQSRVVRFRFTGNIVLYLRSQVEFWCIPEAEEIMGLGVSHF